MAKLIEQRFKISVALKKFNELEFNPIAILTSINLYINHEFIEELLILQGFGNSVEVNHAHNDDENDDYAGTMIYQTTNKKGTIKVTYKRTS